MRRSPWNMHPTCRFCGNAHNPAVWIAMVMVEVMVVMVVMSSAALAWQRQLQLQLQQWLQEKRPANLRRSPSSEDEGDGGGAGCTQSDGSYKIMMHLGEDYEEDSIMGPVPALLVLNGQLPPDQ
ncbi:hypothetical protein M758_7G014900 [Ceratodon purpureus]|nr:hypothetical protein M758_7G014900 [Ceratodon purpureus]